MCSARCALHCATLYCTALHYLRSCWAEAFVAGRAARHLRAGDLMRVLHLLLEAVRGDALHSLMAVPLAGQGPAIKQYLEMGPLSVPGAKQGNFAMVLGVTPPGGAPRPLHCTALRCAALRCTALQ